MHGLELCLFPEKLYDCALVIVKLVSCFFDDGSCALGLMRMCWSFTVPTKLISTRRHNTGHGTAALVLLNSCSASRARFGSEDFGLSALHFVLVNTIQISIFLNPLLYVIATSRRVCGQVAANAKYGRAQRASRISSARGVPRI